MTKQLVMFDYCEAHIDLNTTLDDAIAELQALKDMFITDQVVDHTIEFVGDGMICVSAFRYETDDEQAIRLGEEVKGRLISYHTDNEYEVYLRLKEKYEQQESI
jgi:hypothetical protein